MPKLDFSIDEVQDEAGVRPWDTQRAFSAELDTEEMAETAAVYARAAAEGADAADLAERATEVAAGAGELDGSALVNEDNRIRDTQRNLRPDELEGVPSLLVRAMNSALEADEKAVRLILGDGSLDGRYQGCVTASINEYNGWVAAVNEALAALPPTEDGLAPSFPVSRPGHGTRMVQAMIGPDGRWTADIEGWAPEIRDRHLREAAEAARDADVELTGIIGRYRNELAELAGELDRHEYDLSEGPLKHLFISPQMATWSSETLRELMADGYRPGADRIAALLSGVEGILTSVFEDYGDGPAGEAGRRLTEAEREYLKTFYDGLDPETLAALGNLTVTTGSGLRDEDDPLRELHERIMRVAGDGALVLTDPARGGLDPAAQRQDVPWSIGRYVYLENLDTLSDEDTARYTGFGNLLGQTTVTPGRQFGDDLAWAAVRTIPETTHETDESGRPLDTGTRQMLRLAGQDPLAAAELLGDADFTDRLLTHVYPYDTGTDAAEPEARAFVERATTLPEGVGLDSERGRAHADAAYTYLAYAESAAGADLHNLDAGVIRDLVKTYGELDPERFGRFADLPDQPKVDYLARQ